MSKIFFTSDTHFGAKRTLELSRRPFGSVEEMDVTIIENWNKTVGKDDIVYHLGDFGNYTNAKFLNGYIVLVLGNYELVDITNMFNGNFSTFNDMLNDNNIQQMYFNRFFHRGDSKFFLTHKPEDYRRDAFNLFGHVHKLSMVKNFGLNVGTDCHYYTPIDLDTVLWYKNAIENHYDINAFM